MKKYAIIDVANNSILAFTDEVVIAIGGINHRADSDESKSHGIYRCVPAADVAVPFGFTRGLAEYVIDHNVGTVTETVTNVPASVEDKTATLALRVADKLRTINSQFEDDMRVITSKYPQSEMLSWSKQEAEARAYSLNNAASTPFLDSLAVARNVTKDAVVTRVLTKADAFTTISANLIGKRQKLEDMALALTVNSTQADLDAIIW